MTMKFLVIDEDRIVWGLEDTREKADAAALQTWHEAADNYEDEDEYQQAHDSFKTYQITDELFDYIEQNNICELDMKVVKVRSDNVLDLVEGT